MVLCFEVECMVLIYGNEGEEGKRGDDVCIEACSEPSPG